MENNRFEDSFRNAFAGAEVLPSDTVWTNIELDLEKASGGKMKRNLLMLQLLAAASVAFAFGVSALYYLDRPVTKDDFFRQTVSTQGASQIPETAKEPADQKITSEESIKTNGKQISTDQAVKNLNTDNRKNTASNQLVKEQPVKPPVEYKIARTELSAFIQTKELMLVLPKEEERVEPDAGMVLLARLKDEEKRYHDEEKKTASNEKIWASVGVGAGSYKPNVQSSSASLKATSDGASSSQSESVSGASYSIGINVAAKISKRFIVQGGVSYLTQNADFTSNVSSQQDATLKELMRKDDFDSYQGVSPYVVNSSMQFVSIPVQAGYLVVDRALGIQLNGGISTDLFLSSTLSPENDNYQKVTQAAGKDSPYRTVNFSGLLGTEFSYRIADRYRISLNPGLRYSLNSIYKEDVAAEIIPVTFDVSLRFRYIFK